ncbi:MAG: inositol monophosphatase [Chloroflexota bacterium]|nr:MAG: inositol monophosphatase [Chloroflexota bacterium]
MTNLPSANSGKSALEIAITAVEEAGRILLAHFGSKIQVKHKSKGNLVTDADILSEKFILEFLQDEYPDFDILSEESNSSTSLSGFAWIVDPLDGTNNYTFGIPFFCINIALVKDRDILLGVTYDPVRKELFHAEIGRGAYLNESQIQVSKESSLQSSLVGLDLGYSQERGEEMLQVANRLWGQVHCLRAMGSSSLGLAYVACGRVNLYLHRYLFPWDIASGLLLIREAGGEVTDWQGRPANFRDTEIIASNSQLHREFLAQFGQKQKPE